MKTEFKQPVIEEEILGNSHILKSIVNVVVIETDENCYECENNDDAENLLICDECEFFCCHTYCCNPPLDHVPIEDWFCRYCLQTRRRNRNRRGNNRGGTRGNSNTSRNARQTRSTRGRTAL